MTAEVMGSAVTSGLTVQQKRQLLKDLLRWQAGGKSTFPMSAQQAGLWHAFRRDPDSTAYNVFLPVRIRSTLDASKLRDAMVWLSQRHDMLRTTFCEIGGQLLQTVHPSLDPEFRIIEMAGAGDDTIRQQLIELTQRPFDLQRGPMLRVHVIRVAPDDAVVVATAHHIITDFWSLILVMNEIRDFFAAKAAGSSTALDDDASIDAPDANHYADYVRWQQEQLRGPRRLQLRDYWSSIVADAAQVLDFPTDFRRPARFSGQAATVSIPLNERLSSRLKAFAKTNGATLSAVLMAGLKVCLHRYTRQACFLIGTPLSGRSEQRFENTLGLFSGVLPMLADFRGEPCFAEVVRQTSTGLIGAMEHEAYPLADIVRDAQPLRDPSRSPLFQVLCTFEKSHHRSESERAGFLIGNVQRTADVGGMLQESFPVSPPTCHYDLEFTFDTAGSSVGGMIGFATDLFDASSMSSLAKNLCDLLEQLLDSPTIPLGDVAWSPDPIGRAISTEQKASVPDVVGSLRDAIDRFQERPAWDSPDGSANYGDLDRLSADLAERLIELGVRTGDPVPVVAEKSPRSLPLLLGVMRCGATVVPIDAGQPAMKLTELQRESQAKVIVADHPLEPIPGVTVLAPVQNSVASSRSVSGNHPSKTIRLWKNVDPKSLAYVIFTSGSTGRPKGVMIEHAAITNTLAWRRSAVPLSPDDRVIMLLSHQFDAGFGQILTALTQGACLVWPQADGDAFDLDVVVDTLVDQRITVLTAPPSLLQPIVDHPRFTDWKTARQIWTGGEAMPSDLPGKVAERVGAAVWNFYGPTEAAIDVTAHRVSPVHDPRRPVPIGTAIDGAGVVIVDDTRQSVPIGVPGQLAIIGAGLARGYFSDNELTRAKFVTLSDGRRAYLSGDLGRRLQDGLIEFLGRDDGQVKVRGYRLELAEIEQRLRREPGVSDAGLCVMGEGPSARLIAFVETTAGDDVAPVRCDDLPKYKRPDRVLTCPHIPKSPGGKVDRRALSEMAIPILTQREESKDGWSSSSCPLERYLAERWAEMLRLASVPTDRDFFELGGSSLLAAGLTSRLTEDLGVRVPTTLLFDLIDVRGMSRRLRELHPATMDRRFGAERGWMGVEDGAGQGSRVDLSTEDTVHPLIAPFRRDGSRPPIVLIHPPGGIVTCYRELSTRLSDDQPLYGVRSRGLHSDETLPKDLQGMAADYADAIGKTCPDQELVLGGWSLGGLVAVEVARLLWKSGCDVQRLLLLDTTLPDEASGRVGREYGIDLSLDQLAALPAEDQLPFLYDHARKLGVLDDTTPEETVRQTLQDLRRLFHHHVQVISRSRIQEVDFPITLYRPQESPVQSEGPRDRGWSTVAADVTVVEVPGHHHSMLSPPHVRALADAIAEACV